MSYNWFVMILVSLKLVWIFWMSGSLTSQVQNINMFIKIKSGKQLVHVKLVMDLDLGETRPFKGGSRYPKVI